MPAAGEAPGEAAQHSRLLRVAQGEQGLDFHCKHLLLPGKPPLAAAAGYSTVSKVPHTAFLGVSGKDKGCCPNSPRVLLLCGLFPPPQPWMDCNWGSRKGERLL